jgi:ubiquinone/menaquinone biosynthesis C-methylase UbiE
MNNLNDILICPSCRVKFEKFNNSQICNNNICSNFKTTLIKIKDKPVFIDFSNFMISKKNFLEFNSSSNNVRKNSFFSKFIKSIIYGKSLKTRSNIKSLINNNDTNKKILVVGGGTIGAGLSKFYKDFKKQIISFDIYYSDNIDFMADAHNMPFKNSSFDFVIIQAVLEHVMYPNTVVSEIYRVLKNNGVIYSETPFMQQVHEGPYDFSRFTESGHRLLFNNFECIKSGFIGGLGTSLLWSIEYFFTGLFRSRKIGKISKLIFFWLRFIDLIIPYKYNIDGGCGFFFSGRKKIKKISDIEVVNFYNGSQTF